MNALARMISSPACWDARFDLPLCPSSNNPWIYMAYADLALRLNGQRLDRQEIVTHFNRCRVESSGAFWRWPDHSGGQNSHDEIIGAASLHPAIAGAILVYLDQHWGDFNVTGEKPKHWLGFNVYRMVWLRPFLLASAGRRVGVLSQLVFAIHVTVSAFTDLDAGNAGGRLRNWLMLDRMRGLPLVRLPARLWVKRVSAVSSLRGSLAIEPGVPAISEAAPEAWSFP